MSGAPNRSPALPVIIAMAVGAVAAVLAVVALGSARAEPVPVTPVQAAGAQRPTRAAAPSAEGLAPASRSLADLRSTQGADGLWRTDATSGAVPAAVGTPARDTGAAISAFLGGGHDHRAPSPHRAAVAAAVDGLIALQRADGRFAERVGDHAVALQALASAFAMTGDQRLRDPVERGATALLAARAPTPLGQAWAETTPGGAELVLRTQHEALMALKAVLSGNLMPAEMVDSRQQSCAWLEAAWRSAGAGSTLPTRWDAATGAPLDRDGGVRDGLMIAAFGGIRDDAPLVRALFQAWPVLGDADAAGSEHEATLALFHRLPRDHARWAALETRLIAISAAGPSTVSAQAQAIAASQLLEQVRGPRPRVSAPSGATPAPPRDPG